MAGWGALSTGYRLHIGPCTVCTKAARHNYKNQKTKKQGSTNSKLDCIGLLRIAIAQVAQMVANRAMSSDGQASLLPWLVSIMHVHDLSNNVDLNS